MILEIQICTIGDGILKVPEMLLQERPDVRYLVSWQNGNPLDVPKAEVLSCFRRKDIRLFTLQGCGLSRNRNNALMRTEGDIVLISDDDCKYTNEYLDNIISTYRQEPEADVILFKANYPKAYPAGQMSYRKAMRCKGYYPASVEITIARKAIESGLRFNEDFGLGSGKYICGEESVLLKDAERSGMNILFVPRLIVDTPAGTTGEKFLTDINVQKAKGATFRYCYPRWEAWLRCWKEAMHHAIYNHADARKIFKNMWQ